MFKLLMCLLAIAPFTANLQAAPILKSANNSAKVDNSLAPVPPSLKVLLAHQYDGVILEVKGKYRVYDARNMQLLGTRYFGKRQFLQATNQGIVWGEEFPGIHQIVISPYNLSTVISVDGVEHAGDVYIYDVGGTISLVNRIDVEKFLDLTLPHEYHEPLPQEVLNAIAITARTNAYYQSENGRSAFWDVEGSKVGFKGETFCIPGSEMGRAIKDTAHMILNKVWEKEGVVTTFPAYWRPLDGRPFVTKGEYAKITVEEAVKLARQGKNAAQILESAFPGTKVAIVQY